MAFITQKTVDIFVLLVLPQVYLSHARHTQLVYEPRAHLDSGQVSVSEAFPDYLLEENADKKILRSSELPYEEDLNAMNDNLDFDETSENENGIVEVPLKRVKRRLVVAGGGGGRRRNGRKNPKITIHSRDPDGIRSDNPYVPPYSARSGEPLFRKRAPMGSPALYALLPELAPPGWKP